MYMSEYLSKVSHLRRMLCRTAGKPSSAHTCQSEQRLSQCPLPRSITLGSPWAFHMTYSKLEKTPSKTYLDIHRASILQNTNMFKI